MEDRKKREAYEQLQKGEITVEQMRVRFGLPIQASFKNAAKSGDDSVVVGEKVNDGGQNADESSNDNENAV